MTIAVFVFSLLGAMALGMPIAYALLVCGVALMGYLALIGGLPAFDSQIIAQRFVDGADNFPLLAVPFFLLAGEFMTAGGLSRIVNMAMAWVGHFRGGMGYVAVVAAIIMASISGSAVADTAALAALLIPMMKAAGYQVNRSAGLIAAGGIIAPVIPPSIGMILLGGYLLFSGAGGLHGTTADYFRFAQMLLNGGELDGVRVLSPASVRLMTSKASVAGNARGGWYSGRPA